MWSIDQVVDHAAGEWRCIFDTRDGRHQVYAAERRARGTTLRLVVQRRYDAQYDHEQITLRAMLGVEYRDVGMFAYERNGKETGEQAVRALFDMVSTRE